MNINEGVTLVKMAVAVLVLSLTISAVMSVFYLMSNFENKTRHQLSKAKESASIDRLYELDNQSKIADKGDGVFPLVTNVVNTLTELEDVDLLFVYTDYTKDGLNFTDGHIFTYDTVSITNAHTSGLKASTITQHKSPDLIPIATRHLLSYSKQRCYLEIFETKYNNVNYTCIRISIIESW